jgi:phage shock protein PspC (stress-responsive transcriptional regulator)
MSTAARHFRRSRRQVISGVAGGVAEYLGMNEWVVRAFFLLLTLIPPYTLGIFLYLVLWAAMGRPGTAEATEGTPAGARSERVLTSLEGWVNITKKLVVIAAGLVSIVKLGIPVVGDVRTVLAMLEEPAPLATADIAQLPPPAESPPSVRAPAANALTPPAPSSASGRRARARAGTGSAAAAPVREPDHESDHEPMLRRLIERAGEAEVEALRTLDLAPLYRVYAGEVPASTRQTIAALRLMQVQVNSELVDRRFQRFSVAPDGSRATVRMTERWRMRWQSEATQECLQFPERSLPQTVHLQRSAARGWLIDSIVFDPAPDPTPSPC